MWRFNRRFKRIIVLQLGFENFAQGILYIIVASSQSAKSGNVRVSVIIGIVQALCFCGFQIFELKDLAVGVGSGGNLADAYATPPVTPHSPPLPSHPPPPPPAPATSGGGQSPIVLSMPPAAREASK